MSQERGSRAGLPWLWGPQTCTELPCPALCALSCIVLPRCLQGRRGAPPAVCWVLQAGRRALGGQREGAPALAPGFAARLTLACSTRLGCGCAPCSTVMELREPEGRRGDLLGACASSCGWVCPMPARGPSLPVACRDPGQRRAETPGSGVLPSSPRPRGAAAHCPAGLRQPSPAASALFFSWLGRCEAGGEAVTEAGSNEMSYKNDFINRRFL